MSLETELAEAVGVTHVLTDPGLTSSYTVDWTGRFVGSARAVVRPATAAQVADVVTLCAGYGVAVVPQGGNTGLVGGGTPFFTALDSWVNLNLVETRTFPGGVVLTRYETRR